MQANNPVKAEPLKYQQKIGSTVYNVYVNFNQNSKETIEDKILRLIEIALRKTA